MQSTTSNGYSCFHLQEDETEAGGVKGSLCEGAGQASVHTLSYLSSELRSSVRGLPVALQPLLLRKAERAF